MFSRMPGMPGMQPIVVNTCAALGFVHGGAPGEVAMPLYGPYAPIIMKQSPRFPGTACAHLMRAHGVIHG